MYAIHRWMERQIPDIRSVFEVVNVPGRIYVEASTREKVPELMRNCVWSRSTLSNIHKVDTPEYTSLLTPFRPPDIELHLWVKNRGGLYNGDIGQVRALHEDVGEVEVAVVPRVAPAPNLKPSKRARKRDRRPLPRRLLWEDAIKEYTVKYVKTVGTGFELKGNLHDDRGFRLLMVGRDAIELTKPTMQQISDFTDAAIEYIINQHEDTRDYTDCDIWRAGHIDLKKLHVECLLKIGDNVEIVEGTRQGLRGRVANTAKNGKIQLLADMEDEPGLSTVEIEEELDVVRARFDIGQSVMIRIGTFAGRTGIVEDVNNGRVIIRESQSLKEVSKMYIIYYKMQ